MRTESSDAIRSPDRRDFWRYGWLSKLWSLFLGTLNIRGRIIIGTQKGTNILTTNHIIFQTDDLKEGTHSMLSTDTHGLVWVQDSGQNYTALRKQKATERGIFPKCIAGNLDTRTLHCFGIGLQYLSHPFRSASSPPQTLSRADFWNYSRTLREATNISKLLTLNPKPLILVSL